MNALGFQLAILDIPFYIHSSIKERFLKLKSDKNIYLFYRFLYRSHCNRC